MTTHTTSSSFAPECPIPIDRYPEVTLAHGGGGRLMNQLVEEMFVATFGTRIDAQRHDGAVVVSPPGRLALSTDSFVVRPLDFPGGCIGSLAVYGTANDLAMCGARPLYLTAGFILEEGLPIATLWRQVLAMQDAARTAGVHIITGDTKVVERGKGDGIFINTAGVGVVLAPRTIAPSSVRPGDAVLVSGDLGRHGMAVMAARDGLVFETTIHSDCGYLGTPVLAMIEAGIDIHCLRDLTRGGLASALNEVATVSGVSVQIDETCIQVAEEVRGACEIFGLDPLYVANEGRFAAWVPEAQAERALAVMRHHAISAGAIRIGSAHESVDRPIVVGKNAFGASRVIDMLSGEQLPRIC